MTSYAGTVKALDDFERLSSVVDGFIRGVETQCKHAALDAEQTDRVWGSVVDCMEKSAAGGATPPNFWNQFKQHAKGVNWKNPFTWGDAAAGGLASGLGSLLYTGLRSRSKDEDRRPWLRNFLLASLLGGFATPYVSPFLGQGFNRIKTRFARTELPGGEGAVGPAANAVNVGGSWVSPEDAGQLTTEIRK